MLFNQKWKTYLCMLCALTLWEPTIDWSDERKQTPTIIFHIYSMSAWMHVLFQLQETKKFSMTLMSNFYIFTGNHIDFIHSPSTLQPTPLQFNAIQHNSSVINSVFMKLVHFQFLLTSSERWLFNYMFIMFVAMVNWTAIHWEVFLISWSSLLPEMYASTRVITCHDVTIALFYT